MAKNYTKQEMIRIIKADIETPELVTGRINRTFCQIHAQEENTAHRRKKSIRWQVAAAVAGAMILGTVTVGAAGFFLWNPDVAEKFDANEVQQKELEEKKVTAPIEASATDNGVTISLEQSLMTEKYMYLYFKITAPEDMILTGDTFFDENTLLINGKEGKLSYCGGLPDNMEDGTDNVTYWECFGQLVEKQDLTGQEFTAHFKDLIENDKAKDVEETLVEGSWDVTWTLDYEPSEEIFEVNEFLDASNITVKEIAISPISFEVAYDWKRQKQTIHVIDENGNYVDGEEYVDPPVSARQFRMKDGSLEDVDCGGMGSAGYESEDENDNTYLVSFGSTKVYSLEDIESVIFEDWESGQTYEIPLRN